MMESNEVEQLFQEKGFQRRAKLINSDDLEFEITETDSEKIRDTIGALNHNFKGKKKIRVKSVFDLSGRANPHSRQFKSISVF
ncbi:hypothetical protein C9994_12150 [Marivirga lumbricoides]|uniref:Uncharacterized protein n=1 Tax=Marivirga lumbricoides TaxID=1046115 RepID=A0A2T4DKU3_9BACT|nr:hypothetical protein C9994_12150 [Marivirga lumbricoides]